MTRFHALFVVIVINKLYLIESYGYNSGFAYIWTLDTFFTDCLISEGKCSAFNIFIHKSDFKKCSVI